MAEAHVRSEAAVRELAELVGELRGGGVVQRGRILARGARILRGLTPSQRRTVAIEVARNAAPHLVERIQAEGGPAGEVDLSPGQIKAVFDMVARLDEEGADSLVQTLRDPDWQRQALGLVAGEVEDGANDDAEPDEATSALLGAATLEEYEAALDAEVEVEAGAEVEVEAGAEVEVEADAEAGAEVEVETDAEVEADAADEDDGSATASPDLPDGRDTDLDAAAAEVRRLEEEARRLQAEAETTPEFAAPPGSYEPAMPELASYDAQGIDPDLLSFGSPAPTGVHDAPEVGTDASTSGPGSLRDRGADGGTERSWFGGADLGIASLEPEQTPLSERLLRLERGSQRLRLANRAIDDIAEMGPDEQIGVLLALPDGWVRRRVLHRLLEAGGLSQVSGPRALRTLGHDIDRAWVAASMIENDVLLLEDVAHLLSERARDRLAARYVDAGV